MNFISQELEKYVENNSEKEPVLLENLNRETNLKVLQPRMLSGAYQGRVLSLLSKLARPKTILEIGTYTGYSALCLAEGLQPNGRLHTIDSNAELQEIQQKYFLASAYKDQIEQYVGDAAKVIPALELYFDLVFIDADKSSYPKYFELVIEKMNPGGIILSDNVLWSGKVIEDLNAHDEDTKALVQYNTLLATDPRVESVLLPIRDGLTISRVV